MSLLAFTLAVSTLGSTPSYSVVVSRRVGLDAAAGLDLADGLSLSLERVPQPPGKRVAPRAVTVTLAAAGTADSASCEGSVDCVAALGRIAGLDRLVGLQVVKIGNDIVIDAAVVDVKEGAPLATASAKIPLKAPGPSFAALAQDLTRGVETWAAPSPPPPAPSAVPLPASLASQTPPAAPPPRQVAPVSSVAAPTPTPRLVGYGLAGAGVACVAGGVTFGLLAQDAHRSAKALADAADPLRRADFDAAKAATGTRMVVADVLYVAGALALGAGSYFIIFGEGAKEAPKVAVSARAGGGGGALVVGWSF